MKHMSRSYKAVQVTKPGKLEFVEKPIVEPAFGQVRIRVEACGVCHTDALTVEGGFPGLTYPRVPGHEVIGKIEAIGPGVRSEEHTSELQSQSNLVCRLLLEKKKKNKT